MSVQRVMRIATGETRPITKVYANGAFDCPWCGGGNDADSEQCVNPACWANKHAKPEQIHAERVRHAEQEQQRATLEAAYADTLKRAQQARDREAELWSALRAKAVDGGQCVPCLRKSGWRYDRPRFVKHRKLENCPNAGR